MIYVFDRTVEDVLRAVELKSKIVLKGWTTLTAAEQTEWLNGMRGALNYTDLNRIEQNCYVLASNLEANGYAAPVVVKMNWGYADNCDTAQLERVRQNIIIIRNALTLPRSVPQVPASLEYLDVNKLNVIEYILYAVECALTGTIGSMKHLNTFREGAYGQLF